MSFFFQRRCAKKLLISSASSGGEMMIKERRCIGMPGGRCVFQKKKRGGMGFRDLHSFNLAMLAKQVWRIIDEPESLCARVLRAKYFPDGDILKAGPRAGSSFTWQSICAGIQTFKRGCIWRVGSGDSINIWSDPWIPASPNKKFFLRGDNLFFQGSRS
jgi:hypothetical protein